MSTSTRPIRWTYTPESFPEDCWNLSDEAYRLHLEGLTWSNRRQLDCRIPAGDFRRFSTNNGAGIAELVAAEFWRPDGPDHFVIVKHADAQRTSAQVRKRQAVGRSNGAGGRRPQQCAVISTRGRPLVPVGLAVRQQDGADWLYRYWDRNGVLLYVGIAWDAAARGIAHARESAWWRFVSAGKAESVPGGESRTRERAAIETERPLFNVKHSPVPIETVIEYCAAREAWDLVDAYLPRSANPKSNRKGQDGTGRAVVKEVAELSEEEQMLREQELHEAALAARQLGE